MNNDLISRSELKKCAIPCEIHNGALTDLCVPLYQINNAPTVEPDMDFAKECYANGYEDGKNERPQGECENCDFRKFTETFVDGVVEVMNKNGITSVEQLSEILKGGAE